MTVATPSIPIVETYIYEKKVNGMNGEMTYKNAGQIHTRKEDLPIAFTMARGDTDLITRLNKQYPCVPGWTRVSTSWNQITVQRTPRFNGTTEEAMDLLKSMHTTSKMTTVSIPITIELQNRFYNKREFDCYSYRSNSLGYTIKKDSTGRSILIYTTPKIARKRKKKALKTEQNRRTYPREYDIDTLHRRVREAIGKKINSDWLSYSMRCYDSSRIKKTCNKTGKMLTLFKVLKVDISRTPMRNKLSWRK